MGSHTEFIPTGDLCPMGMNALGCVGIRSRWFSLLFRKPLLKLLNLQRYGEHTDSHVPFTTVSVSEGDPAFLAAAVACLG